MSLSSVERTADGRGDARFAISNSTQDARAFTRCMIGFGAVAVLSCLALLAAGTVDSGQATSGAVTAAVICVGLPACFGVSRRIGRKEVRVNGNGVLLASRLNVADYPWMDIASVRISSAAPSGLYGLMIKATRAADKRGAVELELRRPHRVGLSSGTRSAGLSTGIYKVRLYLDDPDGFMAVARAYLAA